MFCRNGGLSVDTEVFILGAGGPLFLSTTDPVGMEEEFRGVSGGSTAKATESPDSVCQSEGRRKKRRRERDNIFLKLWAKDFKQHRPMQSSGHTLSYLERGEPFYGRDPAGTGAWASSSSTVFGVEEYHYWRQHA